MASGSRSTSSRRSRNEAEIFDRLFELDREDISWIRQHIGDHIAACKAYLNERPPRWRRALREAEEASNVAFAEGMTNIESKINFYIAHCYRGLGMWERAYQYYMESTVDTQDVYRLQALQALSRQRMEEEQNPRLRRVRGSGDLRAAYNYRTKLR